MSLGDALANVSKLTVTRGLVNIHVFMQFYC